MWVGGLYVCECGWGDCMCVNVDGGTVCVNVVGVGLCGGGRRGDRMFEQLGDSKSVCGGGGVGRGRG